MIKLPRKIKSPLKSLYYFIQSVYQKVNPGYNKNDFYGSCPVCGHFTKFFYVKLFDENSNVVKSCNWDKVYTENINVVNSMNCSRCFTKYRVRVAAECFLSYFGSKKIKSIKKFLSKEWIKDFKILETASTDGIFSSSGDSRAIIKSEYFDDIPRGQEKEGIRSEDLQELTFGDDTLDCVIALDVFEHIPEPIKAFSEVRRVLKKGGVGIITVPIDRRNENTKILASITDGKIVYTSSPSYHSDPLRENGALVFTEFGTDIKKILISEGFNAELKEYCEPKKNQYQYLIVIKK